MRHWSRTSLTWILAILLTACNSTDKQQPAEYKVSGTAPAGSDVIVKDSDGKRLASTTANNHGAFSLDVELYEPEMLYLESSSGTHTLATGESFAFSNADRFKAMLPYAPKADNVVNIDGVSTLAHAYASHYKTEKNSSENEAFKAGYDQVSDWLGIDIRTYTSNSNVHSYDQLEQNEALKPHLLEAAIIDWCQRMKEWNGPVANSCDVANFYRLAAKDINYDGELNGTVLAGQLELAGVPLDAMVMKKHIPLEVLRRAEKNEYPFSRLEANSFAEKLMSTSNVIVGSGETFQLDKSAPFIEVQGLNEVVNGVHEITYDVFDYAGVKYLTINIAGQEQSLTPGPGKLIVNTREFQNGNVPINFVATSNIGLSSSTGGVINIQNKYETIVDISAGDKDVESAGITLAADISHDQGIQEVRFTVDSTVVQRFGSSGEANEVVEYRHQFDTSTLNDGDHVLLVEVETALGNTYSDSVGFKTRNVGPVINWALPLRDDEKFPNVPVFSALEAIEFQVIDTHPVSVIQLYWGDSQAPLHEFTAGGQIGEQNYSYNLALSIDTRTLYEARHKILIKAQGASGVWSEEEREVLVDWSRPSVSYLEPTGKILRGEGPHYVNFSATDSNAVPEDPLSIDISNPDDPGWEDFAKLSYNPLTGQGSIEINPPLNDGGTRLVDLQITDIAGKSSNAQMNVIYGNVRPFLVDTWSVERNSGVQEKIIYYVKVRDLFAVKDADLSSFTITTNDRAMDTMDSVSIRDGSGDFVIKMGEYTRGYKECGIGKNVKKYRFESTVTYQNDIGMTYSFKFSSLDGVTTNLANNIIGVTRRRDCR
jgi:hypothetical protein